MSVPNADLFFNPTQPITKQGLISCEVTLTFSSL
jgi:hypothetical protein